MCLAKRSCLSGPSAHVQSPRFAKTPTACTVAHGDRSPPEEGSVQTFLAAGPSTLAVAARLDRLALRAVAFSATTAIVATNFKVSMS